MATGERDDSWAVEADAEAAEGVQAAQEIEPGEEHLTLAQRTYLDLRREGMLLKDAMDGAGEPVGRVKSWRAKVEGFAELEQDAREIGCENALATVRRIMTAMESEDPKVAIKAAEVLLKYETRNDPRRIEVSGPNGGPLKAEHDFNEKLIVRQTELWSKALGVDLSDDGSESAQAG